MRRGSGLRAAAILATVAATSAIILACALAPLLLPGDGGIPQRLLLLGAAMMGALTVAVLARG